MKALETDLLEMTYSESGPSSAPVCLLLHGWPDEASTWDGVAPMLNGAGLRTIAPNHRRLDGTRFLSADMPRTRDAARLAMDSIALMDRLGVEMFLIAGHD